MDFGDLLTIVSDDEFEERPVDIEEFVTSPDYLDMPPLSSIQYKIVEKMTQIYRPDTLEYLYGKEKGERLWRASVNECVLMIGKGGGKTLTNTIAMANIAYKLMCLRDPQKYYNKPRGDNIDMINVALNASQATNVFFNPMRDRVRGAPWFNNKFNDGKAGELVFDKNIRCFSGHSEKEGWEGYNLILAILDEIAGFAIENTSGNKQAKTADAIYKMYKGSVDSRFPEYGKLALLSFPRFKGDFITTRYDKVVAEKHTTIRRETIDVDEFNPAMGSRVIEWEEDEVISYKFGRVFALRAPSWVVNPTKELTHYRNAIVDDPADFLSRFACMPPEAIDSFFKDEATVRKAFPDRVGPFYDTEGWTLRADFKPAPDTEYFMHVDLGYKHDRAAVALAHAPRFVESRYGGHQEPQAFVEVDAIRWWTPSTDNEVDFTEIKEFILMLRTRGFNISLVTFDQWQSITMKNELEALGINTDKLSVNKDHYTELKVAMNESRVQGYHEELLIDELLGLRIIKGNKVDHPRKGSNDIADAVCGAVYNAMTHTVYDEDNEMEVLDIRDVVKQQQPVVAKPKVAHSPEPPPREIADWLSQMEVI